MTAPQPDEDLIERTLAGEEGAFSQLYDRHRQRVYSIVYRIIQDPGDAQDATQEVFVKLYRSLSEWNSRKARFSTWLYRLAANHAIDCWRSRRRRLESSPKIATEWEVLGDHTAGDRSPSPLGVLESREVVDRIRGCVDDLPELQKKVFLLRYFQDLKLEEIAEMEECSLGTVKTSLFRGTRTVRRMLRKGRGSQ